MTATSSPSRSGVSSPCSGSSPLTHTRAGGELADGGPARERHRAETVDDDAGQADRLGELLVEVDRHLVAGRGRVPVRLVEVEGLLRHRDGIGAPKLLREAVLGRSLALALAAGDAA